MTIRKKKLSAQAQIRQDMKAITAADDPSTPSPDSFRSEMKTRFNPFRTIGGKLFTVFMVFIVVLVSGAGIYSYNTSKSTLSEEVTVYTEQALGQVTDNLELILKQYVDLTMLLVTDREVSNAITVMSDSSVSSYERLESSRNLDNKLASFALSDSSINAIFYFNMNGELASSYSTLAIDGSVQEEPWFVQALEANGAAVWLGMNPDILQDRNGGSTFGVVRLLKDVYSRNSGVLYLQLNKNVLAEQMMKLKLGDSGSLHVVNESREILFGAHTEQHEGLLEAVTQADMETMSSAGDSLRSYQRNGLLYMQSKLDGLDWHLIGAVPVNELTQSANKILNGTFTMIGLAVLISVIVGIGMMRWIGGPLIRLRNLMNEGERGNLTVRTEVRSKDEIGQVGESFNRMMEQIQKLVQQTNSSAQEVLNTASELTDVSRRTSHSSKEISLATEQIAEGAMTLATEAERGNGISIELGDQMQHVLKANAAMGQSAAGVRELSEQGTSLMGALIGKTEQTEQMTRSLVEKVDRLKASTSSIRRILDVLNGIAQQTNILSLNATIEAARAGAAGKGFMVVADEIRKLADQSRQSIDSVGEMTNAIQAEMEETVAVLSEAYPIFQEQISSVNQTSSMFHEVRNEMEAFTAKLDQVTASLRTLEHSQRTLSEAMSSVSAVSEESSATSEQVASLSSEQLNSSEGLVRLAEKLEQLSEALQKSLARFSI
ncbi:methyl-accepting chemotaxis protein [Xylanibacillus composti]|uniref:Methyl-accepting chemotaxis protein n=1 Tax=Xylanibacillus composti TaxID=1572762 RepID=A0A8J4H6H2_9BACL|nr:methyl-accepting chemotaxis protein [Xylanibacillus composti]MDT9726165.1 methyl-accepting chemotaxis protein [Xylanibacillus composti]GIQ70600.1 methyl-accepting chemotaxis protein [Xylanibacillus composti]